MEERFAATMSSGEDEEKEKKTSRNDPASKQLKDNKDYVFKSSG